MAEELDLQQVQLSVEQILAAVLNKVGTVVMTKKDLVTDYSNFAVAVDPIGDDELQFSLVDAGVVDELSE
jgi:hypothetical protein